MTDLKKDLKIELFKDLGYEEFDWYHRSAWVDELIELLVSKGWVKSI